MKYSTHKLFSLLALTLFLLAGAAAVQAANTPKSLNMSGTINLFNRDASILTVDDLSFILSGSAIIKDSSGKTTTTFQLTPGVKIDFIFTIPPPDGPPNIAGTITSITLRK